MEKLDDFFTQQKTQLVNLENGMNLIVAKAEMQQEYKDTVKLCSNMKIVLDHCKKLVQKHKEMNQSLVVTKMKQARRQHLVMLNMLNALEEKPFDSKPTSANLKPTIVITPAIEAPRMSVMNYHKSPMAKRLKPLQLQFSDFSATFTEADFLTIPKYMCRRTTFDELQNFWNRVIIKCFNEKYELQYKTQPTKLYPRDQELWRLYREQANDFAPGQKFVTEGDIKRTIGKNVDNKDKNKIVMLVHLGLLKTENRKGTFFYLWKK